MLTSIFNYDNPVWRFIGKFFELMILHVLWLICSIPIFTVGASTTAVYYVTLKLVRDEDGSTIRSFFKSFKENFKQSTIIWLIMLAAGAIIGFDLYFFLELYTTVSHFRTFMVVLFSAVAIIYTAIFLYVFPLQSRFYNPVKKTLFNAFFMSIRHLLQTIGIVAIDAAVIVFVMVVPVFLPLLLLFGFPLLAFINSYIFASIFAKYMPSDERTEEDELRPLFADEEDGGKIKMN
ncbi:MAG: YesL family protein [Lachnospiraceae bacterium]